MSLNGDWKLFVPTRLIATGTDLEATISLMEVYGPMIRPSTRQNIRRHYELDAQSSLNRQCDDGWMSPLCWDRQICGWNLPRGFRRTNTQITSFNIAADRPLTRTLVSLVRSWWNIYKHSAYQHRTGLHIQRYAACHEQQGYRDLMIVLDALSSKTSNNNLKRDIGVETRGKNLWIPKLCAQSLYEEKEISYYIQIHIYIYMERCTSYGGLNVTGGSGLFYPPKKPICNRRLRGVTSSTRIKSSGG